MIIRPAGTRDLPQLTILIQQEITFQTQIAHFFEISPGFDARHFAEAKLNAANERIFVAEDGSRLLGYIDVRAIVPSPAAPPKHFLQRMLRRSTPDLAVQTGTVGRIEDCYVESRFQRRGIGTALVKAGLAWLRERGVKRIDLAVLTANANGRAFWEKHGFSPYRLVMSKALE